MDRLDIIIKESIDNVLNEANSFKSHEAKMKAAANAIAKERGVDVKDVFNAMTAKNYALRDINRDLATKRVNYSNKKISSAVLPHSNSDWRDSEALSAQRMRDAKDYFTGDNEFYRAINNDTFGDIDRLGYFGDLYNDEI